MIPQEYIQREIEAFYKAEEGTMFLDTRESQVVKMRHIFYYICRILNPQMSLEAIGQYKVKRDHSTVLNGFRNIKAWTEVDKNFRREVALILNKCFLLAKDYKVASFYKSKEALISRLKTSDKREDMLAAIDEFLEGREDNPKVIELS